MKSFLIKSYTLNCHINKDCTLHSFLDDLIDIFHISKAVQQMYVEIKKFKNKIKKGPDTYVKGFIELWYKRAELDFVKAANIKKFLLDLNDKTTLRCGFNSFLSELVQIFDSYHYTVEEK